MSRAGDCKFDSLHKKQRQKMKPKINLILVHGANGDAELIHLTGVMNNLKYAIY